MKKAYLWVLMLFLLVSSVSAVTPIVRLSMDEDGTDEIGNAVCNAQDDLPTVSSPLYNSTGHSQYFDGTIDSYICDNTTEFNFGNKEFTVMFWYNDTDTGADDTLIQKGYYHDDHNNNYILRHENGFGISFYLYDITVQQCQIRTNKIYHNQAVLVTLLRNSSGVYILANGSNVIGSDQTCTGEEIGNNTAKFIIGNYTGSHFTGNIDEFCVWDAALSESDIDTYWNDGNGSDCDAITTVNFNVYDEYTRALIDDRNVTLELISTPSSSNQTSDNGTFTVNMVKDIDYTIRYSADIYPKREYYLTITNTSTQTINLYLINNTISSEITATVYDEVNNEIEGAIVKAQRYDITTNSYIFHEMCKTNFEGQCSLHLVEDDEYYKFIIEYDGEIKKTTIPTIIRETSITFKIRLTDPTAQNYFYSLGVEYNLSFVEGVNHFRFEYDDTDNQISQACLEVRRQQALGEGDVNSSCATTITGILYVAVPFVNGSTWEAKTYVYYDNIDYFLDSATHTFEQVIISTGIVLFLLIIMTCVFILIGYWSLAVAVVLTPIPMLLFNLIGLTTINYGVIVGVELIAIIIALIISKRA